MVLEVNKFTPSTPRGVRKKGSPAPASRACTAALDLLTCPHPPPPTHPRVCVFIASKKKSVVQSNRPWDLKSVNIGSMIVTIRLRSLAAQPAAGKLWLHSSSAVAGAACGALAAAALAAAFAAGLPGAGPLFTPPAFSFQSEFVYLSRFFRMPVPRKTQRY